MTRYPILIILKPEVFDKNIIISHPETFLESISLPSARELIEELFEGIISEYEGPYGVIWGEEDVRELYNQPHHLIPEIGFPDSRQDTLVDIYNGKYMEIYLAYGSTDDPQKLTLRKKEIRKRFLKNPNVAFYSLYHVSDSVEDAQREIAIYKKYIDGGVL